MMMDIISTLSGPVIGAVIGYFTNYIAVKMLFFPRKAVKVFGKTLPFTPGVIPRRKSALAHAIGNVVENELLTKDALMGMLLTEPVKNKVAIELSNALTSPKLQLSDALRVLPDSEGVREHIELLVTDKLCEAICETDLATPIATEGKDLIKEKFGALASMLVSDEMLQGIAQAANQRIGEYLSENKGVIKNAVHEKSEELISTTLEELTETLGLYPEKLFPVIKDLYQSFINTYSPVLLKHISIAGAVEESINRMDSKALESMILSVMKNELSAVINLGAVVGFILGLANLIF